MARTPRQYDLVLFGATGYTGQYTVQHIVKHLPTDLKWAVAGRSEQKLSAAALSAKNANPDRVQPGVEVTQLNSRELQVLASKTKILLNCVGPYHLYATPVVEACAKAGTHYIDVTGESPWVKEVIEKYQETARASGAIMIPQSGVDSAPADLMSFVLATLIRKSLSAPTKEVIFTLHKVNSRLSGGTLTTALAIMESYSLLAIAKSMSPSSICPVALPARLPSEWTTRLTGVRRVPDLGTLTTSLQGGLDGTIVYRSWGILSPTYSGSAGSAEEYYGPNFHFSPYMTTRNAFTGALTHVILALLPFFLVLAPVRWLIRRLVYKAGEGPTPEEAARESIEYRAIGVPDSPTVNHRAFGRFRYENSVYSLTGVFLAEAAMTLLKDEEKLMKKLKGGFVTPATLGEAYVERLANVGVTFDAKILNY